MTTVSSENGAVTNFSDYVAHVTIFSGILSTACCLVVRLGLYI